MKYDWLYLSGACVARLQFFLLGQSVDVHRDISLDIIIWLRNKSHREKGKGKELNLANMEVIVFQSEFPTSHHTLAVCTSLRITISPLSPSSLREKTCSIPAYSYFRYVWVRRSRCHLMSTGTATYWGKVTKAFTPSERSVIGDDGIIVCCHSM